MPWSDPKVRVVKKVKFDPSKVEWFTTSEVAAVLHVQERSVRRWARQGELEAIRVGHRYRISKKSLDKFMRQRRVR